MVGFSLGGGDVRVSEHAFDRWAERARDVPPRDHKLDESQWYNSDPVSAPGVDGDRVRLYDNPRGRDLLLVGHDKNYGVKIATVLYADHDRLQRY